MNKRFIQSSAIIILVIVSLGMWTGGNVVAQDSAVVVHPKLNMNAVFLLIDLFESIQRKHPDYQAIMANLEEADPNFQRETIEKYAQQNRQDSDLNRKIDALLTSATYKLYYSQFSNIDSSVHREIFMYLPYMAKRTPGAVGDHMYEMCQNVDSLKAWVRDVVAGIDPDKARAIALQWLPEGSYDIPETYFILDGNGDAFARDGKVCFDLYGTILSKRSQDQRYSGLGEVDDSAIQRVLAHEYHHVFARPIIYPWTSSLILGWKSKWLDRLQRQLVSEGSAMLCNPPEGLKRDVMEDSTVVAFWIHELNDRLAGLDTGDVKEEDYAAWFQASFHEEARALLRDYFRQWHEGEELENLVSANQAYRPDFLHTMGWWMVSHITANGSDRKALFDLMKDPAAILERYNEAVTGAPDRFTVYAKE
jgi:hypothetical protein